MKKGENFQKKYWALLENKKKLPKDLKKVSKINSHLFFQKVNSNNKSFIKKMISNLYAGEFYLIKNVVSKKYIDKLKLQLTDYSRKNKSSFHKMLEKCPNFWRIQDENLAKKYSFMAVRDSYYFFRWNKENFKLWKNFDKIWSYIKFLGGLRFDEYKKNTPKDIVIDRIQIVRYPEKTGYNEPHFHDPKNQRLIISLYMSKMGSDYSEGGAYFFKKNKKINVEKSIDVGDVGIFYATLNHGVDPIKINKTIKMKNHLTKDRWWCGLYSPESDLIYSRRTSSKVNLPKS